MEGLFCRLPFLNSTVSGYIARLCLTLKIMGEAGYQPIVEPKRWHVYPLKTVDQTGHMPGMVSLHCVRYR